MNKKILLSIFIITILFIVTGCSSKNINYKNNNINNNYNNVEEVTNTMRIIINNKEYVINLENNETVNSLLNLLPIEIEMNELNGNEKYAYLDNSLPTNTYNPEHINNGDVMLYGNNCIVIFYKSFDTSYSYTKIGHIDNLPDLGNENVKVLITK